MVESSRTMVGEQTGDAPVRDRSNLMLLVLCSAAFMAMLDVFVVSVAFAAIGEGYPGSSLADLSWVLNAYTIVYAALLIPAGRLADRYGRRAGFVVGLVVFTVASLACALGPTLWWLVGFRVLQAVGAAALTPTSLGLLLTALPPERRATAVKIWATSTSLAAAVGPVIGGALVKVSWQWVFLINVPVGIAAVVGAVVLLPETKDATVTRIPDVLGAAVLAVALGSLALALVKGQEWGWSGTGTLTAFAVAVVGLAAVAVRMRRHPAPVVDPALLRVRSFFWSNVTALLFCTVFGAVLPSVILRLQTGAHYSALVTGLAVAPSPLMVPIFAAVSQRLSNRLAPSTLVAIGNVLVGVGVIMLAVSATTTPRRCCRAGSSSVWASGSRCPTSWPRPRSICRPHECPRAVRWSTPAVRWGTCWACPCWSPFSASSVPPTPRRWRCSRTHGGRSQWSRSRVPPPRWG